ncbi:MAG: tRNA (guanosine(46)-N7)-methyltransferase TrmB [Oscillospiraceae bacterium]|nr:tRNA (guanosine(46)-N7)-methyltransferase TrmB [Oscillospiraceae bacterium]
MRMRKKPNLVPRMERCAAVRIEEPTALKGRWLDENKGFDAIYLEIGCGKGRFTAETAASSPDKLMVAVERVPDAMVVGMERAIDAGLRNVRFIDADAATLCEIFADGEVSRIYINFCDPWAKKRHAKRRLTSGGFLDIYSRILAQGGEIHFKTDNDALFEFSLEEFERAGYALSEVTRDLHVNGVVGVMTDYERKFHEQGVKINRCVATLPSEAKARCAASHAEL